MAIIRVTNVPSTALSDDVITSAKIADGTIAVSDLANDSVTAEKIASNAVTSAKIADSNITTAKVADGAITTGHMHSSVPLGTKNLLINGNFDIWQRGTSFSYGAETYNADRWVSWSSSANSTITREEFTSGQTDVPNNPTYFLRYTGNGTQTGVRIDQRIEFPSRFKNKTFALSFYARSSNTLTPGYIYFGMKDISTNTNYDNFSNETVEAISSTWQKFVYTFTPTSFPPSIDEDRDYAQLGFRIPNNYNGTFDIAQVQLEEGSAATSYEYRPYDMELHRCKRYFHTTIVDSFKVGIDGQGGGNWFIQGNTMFPNTMRVAPTLKAYAHGHQSNAMAPYGDGRADNMTFYQNGGTVGYPNHGGNLDFARDRNRISAVSAGFNTTAGVKYFCGFTADAEL